MKAFFFAILVSFYLGGAEAATAEEISPVYMQLLQEIVNINSDTRNPEGLAQMRELLIPHFEALGLKVTRHKLAEGRELLSFEEPGAEPQVLLLGHLDTVFPKAGAFRQLTRQGDRLTGPGVIDMKGGLVLMLNALAQLKRGEQLGKIRVLLNDDEEIGSPYSKRSLRELAQGIPHGLVFEPGLEDGAVVRSQSGVRWIKLTTSGKAAHAGLEPENGINACVDLAHKVTKAAALAQPQKGLTINPGVMEGGTKPNVVCEKASVTIDVRFRDLPDWQAVSEVMEKIRGQSDVYNNKLRQGTSTELTQIAEMPPLPESDTQVLVQQAEEVAQALGQAFQARGVGYGSDANHLAGTSMQLLVGLGPYGGGMHSDKEYMLLSSYSDRLALVTGLLRKLLRAKKGAP